MTGQAEGVGGPDASTALSLERTRLAYDRTMLSWIRTATALITFGFSIEEFFRIARVRVGESKDLIGPREFGLLMISIGLMALLLATLQNRSAIQALAVRYPAKEGYSEIPRSRAVMLAALIAVLGLLCLFSIMVRQ
jgi:inner membrane protein YidH